MGKVNLKRSWNKISKIYQKDFFGKFWGASKFTVQPMDFVGNVKGKKVIELGCGAAQNSIIFAKKGAIVTALDFSEEQINYGRNLAKKHKVKVNFVVGDLNKLGEYFPKNHFDIAFSSYAFQYVKNLNKLFRDVNKILKKNGLFVFSLDHPVFTSGDWVKFRNKQYFFIDNYFKRRKKFWDWEFKNGVKAKFYLYHRTLQDFVDALVKNNFSIKRIVEPEPLKARKAAVKSFEYRNLKKVPHTIIFKARKL